MLKKLFLVMIVDMRLSISSKNGTVRAEKITGDLGSGAFARAELWELTLAEIEGPPLPFVIKRYHPPSSCLDEHQVTHAVRSWEIVRALGLCTPTVYQAMDNRTIFMPLLGDENRICVGPNNPGRCSIALWGFELPETIPNLNQLFMNVVQDVKLAAQHGIAMPSDAQFFLWETTTQNVSVVWADFDHVETSDEDSLEDLTLKNIRNAFIACDRYIQNNVDPRFVDAERNRLKGFTEAAIADLGVSEASLTRFYDRFGNEPLSRWARVAPMPSPGTSILTYPERSDR